MLAGKRILRNLYKENQRKITHIKGAKSIHVKKMVLMVSLAENTRKRDGSGKPGQPCKRFQAGQEVRAPLTITRGHDRKGTGDR